MGVFHKENIKKDLDYRSSPRTWGCFGSRQDDLRQQAGLPHARGGVSASIRKKVVVCTSSPRTWGCFWLLHAHHPDHPVFPTHVGVFPALPAQPHIARRLPHARGGVSHYWRHITINGTSSPRTWGCFQSSMPRWCIPLVFPTHVGVFPNTTSPQQWQTGLPHARGGVFRQPHGEDDEQRSSPRTWGCF